METITGKIEGDHTVSHDVTLYGLVAGDVDVEAGATFILFGMVTGDVRVARGASARLAGTVGGSVTNRGWVAIEGRVVGLLTNLEGGQSAVHPEAAVHEERG